MSESVWTRVIPAETPAWWRGQLLAVAVVAIAFLARWAITPLIGADRLPFLTFFPAVLIVTAIGGRWTGLSALLTSAVVAIWAFTPSTSDLRPASPQVVWFFIAFLLSGGVVWFTAALLRSTVLKFREKKALLEAEAAERERSAQQLRTVAHELEHRVRNLLALIHGLVLQSGGDARERRGLSEGRWASGCRRWPRPSTSSSDIALSLPAPAAAAGRRRQALRLDGRAVPAGRARDHGARRHRPAAGAGPA